MIRMLAFAALAVTFLGASAAPDSLRDALTGATHQHMLMTAPRAARPGDARRAAAIVAAARAVVARYPDAAAAERVGYRKFLPGIELPVEHYVDDAAYAAQDAGHLDPARPAALIFERSGTALRPTGVMYVAAASASDAQLDRAVPLSAARWHRHVDLCFPPDNDIAAAVQPGGRFGFQGSIDTADACRAAGGRWVPALYGWMVHVWPLRSDPWAGDEHAPMPGMVR
ncbi:MAG: hypothetical protein QOI11_1385 [Candidatus Eremiobacteraeota bacterium]|jgi:hypothetical protein|nr:hypothetical protein [Candidatus Eremiobacteraeota bacterium]